MSTARKLMAGAQRAYQFDFIQYLNSITTDGTYKDATGDNRAIKGGMGISFNGTNNYGEVRATNWGTGAKVITTVFKTPASFGTTRVIHSLGVSSYRTYIDPDGVLHFNESTAGETLTTSTVYILQAYYDAGSALTKYILNGTEYTLSVPAGTVSVNTYYIGARNSAVTFFSGEIYYHSVSGFGEWFLEDTDAENTTMTTLYDASGNGNHMTLRGTIANTTRIAVPSQPSVRDLDGYNIMAYKQGPAHGEGSGAFSDATTIGNKAIFAPRDSTYIGIYDLDTNNYTRGPAHGEGSNAFSGVTTIGNKAIFAPRNSTYIGIYDLDTNNYTRGPSHGENSYAFSDATTIGNKAIFAPYDSTYIGIYDLDTNNYTRGPAHGEGNSAFNGATTIGNKVIFAPFNSSYIGIYDLDTNNYTRGPAHGEGSNAFYGATTIGNKVIFAPRNSTYVGIYDLDTNNYTRGPAHGEGSDAFNGATTIGNKAIFAPRRSTYVGIYDLDTNNYTRGPAYGENSYAFSEATTIGNKAIFAPNGSTYVGIYQTDKTATSNIYVPPNLSKPYYDVLSDPLLRIGKCSFDAQIKSTGVYLNGTDSYITAPHTITDFTQGSFFINFSKDSTQSNSAGLLFLTDSNSFRYGAVARTTYDTITFLYKGKYVHSDISALTTKTLEYRFTEVGGVFYVHYKVNDGNESSLSITDDSSASGTANTVYIGYNPVGSLLFKGTFYEIRTPEETWYFKDYLAGATNVTNFVGQNGTLATMNGTVASTTIVSTTGQYPANALQGYDTVLTFDGSNDFIQLNDGSDFNLGNGDFTIEVVADFTYRSIAETDILSKWDFSASKRQYVLRLLKSGGLYFYTSSTGADTHSLVVAPANVPQRIAKFKIERISGTTKTYFDDVEVDYTGAVVDTIYTSDTPLRLGLHNSLYSPIKISKCAITSTDGNIDLTAVQAGTVINGAKATYNGLYDSVSDTFFYNDTPSTNALAIRFITADDSGDNPLTGDPAFYQPSAQYWNGGGTIIQNVNLEWVDSYLTTYKWFTAGVAKELSLADLPSAGDETYWKVGSKYVPLRGDWGVYFCGYLAENKNYFGDGE